MHLIIVSLYLAGTILITIYIFTGRRRQGSSGEGLLWRRLQGIRITAQVHE